VSGDERDPYGHLAAVDPVLAMIIRRHGHPDPFHWGWTSDRPSADPFRTLLLQIVSQHVSTAASFTLFDRVESAAGVITPAAIAGLGPRGLTDAGLPDRKAAAAVALAHAVTTGRIDLGALPADDTAAMDQLTALPGIGPWSAQMFLIGQLHRPDVLPSADFGIRRGVQAAWRLADTPTAAAVTARGRAWTPYRSYAAALIWTYHFATPEAAPGTGPSGSRPEEDGWRGKRAAATQRSTRSGRHNDDLTFPGPAAST
jgi:DNA-3-methyladenine glycosylase II